MLGRLHTVLFRVALVVTLLFVLVATGLAVTRSRLEPVLSGSMTPAIPRHSLVLAVPVASSDLRVGDVVVFQPPGSQSSVMHRIVELSDGTMRTKGDANAVIDPWTIDLSASGMFRVRAAVPRVGAALQFLHNTTRHTGGELTWPGILLLVGAIGYAIRLRHRADDDSDDDPDDDPDEATAEAAIARELRAAGAGIAFCAGQLAGADLDARREQALHTLAGHAERVTELADRLAGPADAEPADAEPADADPAGAGAGYMPRHATR